MSRTLGLSVASRPVKSRKILASDYNSNELDVQGIEAMDQQPRTSSSTPAPNDRHSLGRKRKNEDKQHSNGSGDSTFGTALKGHTNRKEMKNLELEIKI